MRTRLIAVAILAALAGTGQAQEVITLGTPVARPSIATYAPASLTITLVPDAHIRIVIMSGDVEQVFDYPCPQTVPVTCATDTLAETATLIGQLNTANLSTRSLWRRVFDRLVADFPARFSGGGTVQ